MLQFTDKGIYCPQADVYIDPWQPVKRAIITHAHSDHAHAGCSDYLCHPYTRPALKLRLGNNIRVETVEYEVPFRINGVSVSLYPAGHIIGSAQVRLEYKGEVWVVSGDYKLVEDGLTTSFLPVKCHHFVTESTFGLPVYKFPDPFEVYNDINQWWAQNSLEGFNTVLLGYSLGKAQTILRHLETANGPVYLHGAVDNINQALATVGFTFPGIRLTPEMDKKSIKGAAIVAPPSALGSPWMKKLTPFRVAVCSGWMQLRGARRRYGADRGFVLSDHCDWPQLNRAIQLTGAEQIYVTHGYESQFSKWIGEQYALQAHEVHTLYHDDEKEEL